MCFPIEPSFFGHLDVVIMFNRHGKWNHAQLLKRPEIVAATLYVLVVAVDMRHGSLYYPGQGGGEIHSLRMKAKIFTGPVVSVGALIFRNVLTATI